MTDYQTFGTRVTELRNAAGFAKQADLASQLGVSQQTVSRWEAGTSRPRMDDLTKLASALKVDVDVLLPMAGYSPSGSEVRSLDQLLPLERLTPGSFENFCVELLVADFQGKATVHPAGQTGHKQHGIDIRAQINNGAVHTYQCKREAQFGPAKVRSAIRAHTIDADMKYLLLSRVASPKARKEIEQAKGWYLWDKKDISRVFRTLPKRERVRLVDIYFPGQRLNLTGEPAPGPWQAPEYFFAPYLEDGRPFNQAWDLVGRDKELAELTDTLAKRDIPVVSLVGPAGGGKTRLLRSALQRFAKQHPNMRIWLASPSEEITARALEDLGTGAKLLVMDDAHDRDDAAKLIDHAARNQSNVRVLLVYRPYWSDFVQQRLARYGLVGVLSKTVTLGTPTKQDAVTLASQVLDKNGASKDFAQVIADAAYDSPLAVVVGAYIVATEGMHPELLGSNETYQSTVLKRYQEVIAEDIAQGADRERVHGILRTLALIQPLVADDQRVLDLVETVEKIPPHDTARLIRRLIDAGVLFKRGTKHRLSPDLLADSIIESACITVGGASSGYAEKLFAAAIPEHREHALLNLGRLDWRRNKGDTSTSKLLDALWAGLQWHDSYPNADVKAAAETAFFQPRQALDFASQLIDAEHGQDADVCRMIHRAAHNLEHLDRACALLWDAGKHDSRPTNPHPDHAIQLLAQLATPEPRKPVEFVERAVAFAMSILDSPESWQGAFTPMAILRASLAVEGHLTSSASKRDVTLSFYTLPHEQVRAVRQQVINELLESLHSSNHRRAFLAAQCLADALRSPARAPSGNPQPWKQEFKETLERLAQQVETTELPAPVLVRVAESIAWHASCDDVATRSPAKRVLASLDRDLATRTTRALMDPWGTNIWPRRDKADLSRHEAKADKLCKELADAFPAPAELAAFLQARLHDISSVSGNEGYNQSARFLHRLLQSNLPMARYLLEAYLRDQTTALAAYTGRALGVLMEAATIEHARFVEELLQGGEPQTEILAQGYALAPTLEGYSEADRAALLRIFRSRDSGTLWHAGSIALHVARRDPSLAIELTTKMDFKAVMQCSHDVFMWLVDDKILPFEMITDAQLQTLVHGLRPLPKLDDHWVNAFLKKVMRRRPSLVIDLGMTRLEDAIANGDIWLVPLGRGFEKEDSLGLMSSPGGASLLGALFDRALAHIDDPQFFHLFARLVQALCGQYNAPFTTALEQWLENGTATHFKVATAVLQQADTSFVSSNEGFTERTLDAARHVSRRSHHQLTMALASASTTGFRCTDLGQPFPEDLQLKDLAERRLARVARDDPAFELYQMLARHADHAIERRREEGRRLNEEEEGG